MAESKETKKERLECGGHTLADPCSPDKEDPTICARHRQPLQMVEICTAWGMKCAICGQWHHEHDNVLHDVVIGLEIRGMKQNQRMIKWLLFILLTATVALAIWG